MATLTPPRSPPSHRQRRHIRWNGRQNNKWQV